MSLREVQLSKKFKGSSFLYRKEFYDRDLENSISSFTPGEWALLKCDGPEKLLVMVNNLVQQGPKIRSLVEWNASYKGLSEWQILETLIKRSIAKRALFSDLKLGARLVYGESDNLPGLIVDQYQNLVLIQINSAGIDRFRETIQKFFSETFNVPSFLFDNQEYRSLEMLPQFSKTSLPDLLEVSESGFNFRLPTSSLQKIGHYYDHRVNRQKLERILNQFQGKKKVGLDLFSYSGMWGLTALRSGVEKMIFVDQAPFKELVLDQIKINGFEGRGDFVRSDVFDYLEQQLLEKKSFDLIISDPPAFSKNLKNKTKALVGYEKLHTACLKLLSKDSLLVVASCTHGVTHDELDRTVIESVKKSGRKVQLIDIGIQGMDHPFSHLHESSFYIKYLLYFVE